jgi:HSP20 family protein
MNLIRWNVLPEMSILQRQMNRLFDEATQNWNGDANTPNGWSPETDIYETEADLVLQTDLPGFNAKDIDIVVENSVLTIRGERQFEAKVQAEGLHRMERSYGKFSRSFTLPASVNRRTTRTVFSPSIWLRRNTLGRNKFRLRRLSRKDKKS